MVQTIDLLEFLFYPTYFIRFSMDTEYIKAVKAILWDHVDCFFFEDVMNKFEGIMICTDLDGTLLSDKHTISPENLDAIEYFKANGGKFTFITGRVPLRKPDLA